MKSQIQPSPAVPAAGECVRLCATLAPVEHATLVLLAQGNSTKQAARLLGRAPKTVEASRKRVMRRLNVNSILQAAVIAAKGGLV